MKARSRQLWTVPSTRHEQGGGASRLAHARAAFVHYLSCVVRHAGVSPRAQSTAPKVSDYITRRYHVRTKIGSTSSALSGSGSKQANTKLERGTLRGVGIYFTRPARVRRGEWEVGAAAGRSIRNQFVAQIHN
eukprot:7380535-Prymnesium_polylepis.1